MRDFAKLLIKYLMRFVLRIFWLFPINKKKCFFMSTMGKNYSCNPKYLYESMLEDRLFQDMKYVWCFISPSTVSMPSSSKTTVISKSNKLIYFYHLLTSKVVVYNCGGFSYAPIRKSQLLIETWHGAGTFKKVNLTVQNKSKSSKKGVRLASSEIKLFLATCRVNTEMFIRRGMGYSGEVINSGFPRNDMLVNADKTKILEVRKKINLQDGEHLVLYAPTFKGQEHSATNIKDCYEVLNPVDLKKCLEKHFSGKWKFATRGHQYAGDFVLPGTDFDLSSYHDMQELLLVTDVLVTDYSSSIWDFALTKKPCFLFVPDRKDYEIKERGFLSPIESWPAVAVESNIALHNAIVNWSSNEYQKHVDDYFERCGSYESGKASVMIKRRIYKMLHSN